MARGAWADNVMETTTTTGTGTISLAGAVTGYRTFIAGLHDGAAVRFKIEAVDGNGVPTGEWEDVEGILTDASPDTLTRVKVYGSSNSGSLVSLSAGTKRVYLVRTASMHYPDDPIFNVFGVPDTAFEFDGSSLTGLTALSPTPDVEAAHTVIPGHYFLRNDATTTSAVGRYASASQPFTGITKLSDANPQGDYSRTGIFIGESTPGVMESCNYGVNSGSPVLGRTVAHYRYTNPTTYGAVANGGNNLYIQPPIYLAIRVNSGTSIDCLWSHNGYAWVKFVSARNPSITIGSCGLYLNSETAGATVVSAAFDFLRIWNSALTFPGVP